MHAKWGSVTYMAAVWAKQRIASTNGNNLL